MCWNLTFLLFSRDKTNLDKFVNEERIELLLNFAALIGATADKIGSVKDFTSKLNWNILMY